MKICFLGAGSTVFAKNILGDCILTPELGEFEIALHDIDAQRLDQSFRLISAVNQKYGGKAKISRHLDRRESLKGADFIVNAIQVGGYKPCTKTDFDIPKKYLLRQTIGDTLGIGGIMRGLRTIHVLEDIAKDIEELCPNALFLNYTNPMAILSGYLQTRTRVKAVGLCHSVQACVPGLLDMFGMKDKEEGCTWQIYGINHQAWLTELLDKDGNDLYPEIKARSLSGKYPKRDLVRRELMHTFGYYVTESSEHNAEYTPYFIKDLYPGLIRKYKIPLDEYPRRCRHQIRDWKRNARRLDSGEILEHTRSHEYGSRIITAVVTDKPFFFHGNFSNASLLIPNLPPEACVEVPAAVDKSGFHPFKCPRLPEQCAALNRTNINVQLLTLRAAETRRIDDIIHAAALDPHTASELSLDDIKDMVKELYKAHHKGGYLPEYK
jgi:alpha-galactosidase